MLITSLFSVVIKLSLTVHFYLETVSSMHSASWFHSKFSNKNYLALSPIFLVLAETLREFFILIGTSCLMNKILSLSKIFISGFYAGTLINPLFRFSWHFLCSNKYKEFLFSFNNITKCRFITNFFWRFKLFICKSD